MGPQVLHAVVLLGDPLASATGHRRRLPDQAPSLRSAELLLGRPNHQRRCRRPQLRDPDHQEDGLRLPQQGALQDGHLLPLRRATALPCCPRNCRMTHISKLEFSRCEKGNALSDRPKVSPETRMLVDGKPVDADPGKMFATVNPATAAVLAHV